MKQQEKSRSAVAILKNGGVIIFPTDTVYGIGCVSNNPKAVNKIYKIKGTPKTQPFPILVSAVDQITKLAQVNDTAKNLIKKYWPGGLTIILTQRTSLTHPRLSTYSKPGLEQLREQRSVSKKIGFRMPDSELIQYLIQEVGPIVGTSANFHGAPTPKKYEDLDPNFTKLADFVLKGKCKTGIESTVVDATIGSPKILRQGAVTLNNHLRGGL